MGWQATIVAVQAVPARDLKTAMARIRPDEPVGLWAGLAYQSRGRATTGPSRLPGPKPPANSPPRSHARKLPARSIRDGTGRTRCPLDRPGRTSSGPPGRRRLVARRGRAADRARPAGRG